MAEIKLYTKDCVHGGNPPCVSFCPFGFDIRKFLLKINAGNFNSAYKEYRNKVIFPAIVSRICERPCMRDCPVSLSMPLLERACVDFTRDRTPEAYNLPKREETVAVIGAGLSGLACTQRLAMKKYAVTIFERAEQFGGSLQGLIPEDIYLEEIRLQLSRVGYTAVTGKEVVSLETAELSCFGAVYIATGSGGSDFGLRDGWDPLSLSTTREGTFLGGELSGCGRMEALAQGLTAAASIEAWLKIGRTSRLPEVMDVCEIRVPSYEDKAHTPPVIPADGISYTREEASEEAGRCLHCDCTYCYDSCEFMKEQGMPPRLLEVNTINDRGQIKRIASKMIASCALCGHCGAVCSYGVSVEPAMRRGKQALFEDGGFAPVYHDFYMRDMEDAMNASYLCRPAPGTSRAKYIFFPGCQAAKVDPEYVRLPYRYMLERDPDTALMLACCGVPALYAGDIKKMQEAQNRIMEDIRDLGNPVVVLSCATCAKTFNGFLPEIQCMSLFEYIQEKGLPDQAAAPSGTWALFDPCSSRIFPEMQEAVRSLLDAVGARVEELPENRARALCCGRGGHIYAANPKLAKKFAGAAIAQSDLPYIAYCTNCQEIFSEEGKETVYLLDLLFGIEPHTAPVHIQRKEENRKGIKADMLEEFWGETSGDDPLPYDAALAGLQIPEAILSSMDRMLISAREAAEVVDYCERESTYLIDRNTGYRIAHKKIGLITCWVVYNRREDHAEVINVYSHRIAFTEKASC